MIHTFKCPSCGAPLKFDDSGDEAEATNMPCSYCGMSAAIPASLRPTVSTPKVPRRISLQVSNEIQALVGRGNKIQAIKLLREHTGLGLKASKDAIDAFADGDVDVLNQLLSVGSSRPVTARPQTGGCAGAVFSIALAAVLIGGVAIYTMNRAGINTPNVISVGPINIPLNNADGTDTPFSNLINTNTNTNAQTYDSLNMQGKAELVTWDDQAQPDIAGLAYHIKDSKNELAYIDGAKNKVNWRVDADIQSKFVTSADTVYVSNKTRLLAVNRSMGVPRWETSLSDTIAGSCDDCLALAGNRVIAMSNDSILQAFDVATGKRMWSLTLSPVVPRFFVWNDKVVAIDRDEAVVGLGTQVRVVDATGDVQTKFNITCTTPRTQDSVGGEESAYPYAAMQFDSAAGALYTWYGGFSSCVQKWDLTTGEAAWTTQLDADPPEQSDPRFVMSKDTLFMGGADQIFAVNTATGETTEIVKENADYDYMVPIDARDGVLVVQTTRTRGTRRLELWGVEVASGNKLWDVKFDEGGMMGGVFGRDGLAGFVRRGDDDVAWTAHIIPSGELVIVRLVGKPELQLTVETLNVKDGTSKGQQAIPLNKGDTFFSAPRVIGWHGATVWLHMDGQYYGVDTAAARITFHTP